MRMLNKIALTSLTCLLVGSLGCSFMARGPEDYRNDTASLLETKRGEIKGCYDRALEADASVGGKVVLNFTVEQKTGTIKDVAVAPGTTAPEQLSQCVVTAVQDLKLTPEDQRDGLATFTWEFKANQPAAAGAPAA